MQERWTLEIDSIAIQLKAKPVLVVQHGDHARIALYFDRLLDYFAFLLFCRFAQRFFVLKLIRILFGLNESLMDLPNSNEAMNSSQL